MDAQAKKKALFRAKLNAKKQEKQRIDSPLVRYNENDQPVCRVCDVTIKSDSLWPAHQASRKHHEAIDKLKANAAAVNRPNSKQEPTKELLKHKPGSTGELNGKPEPSTTLPSNRSSTLPPDFFDNHETKRQKTERDSSMFGEHDSLKDTVSAKIQVVQTFGAGSEGNISTAAESFQKADPEFQASEGVQQGSETSTSSGAKQVKGALPEGFFDDKDSDLRARGITPVKPDVKDEYKEFEKLIQEDLKEVDNRLEEEEYDAAEMIEEEETVEQKSYKERVKMLRRKKLELRASKPAVENTEGKESRHDDSSSDDDDDDNFGVDWRAKHI